MDTEIRVFICDSSTWYTDPRIDIVMAMECAESQGTVMTLPMFINQFNGGVLNDLLNKDTVTIDMAEFTTDGKFIREVK